MTMLLISIPTNLMRKIYLPALATLLFISFAANFSTNLHAQENLDSGQVFDTAQHKVRAVTLMSGLEHPWALAFLPDGRWLITERKGTMRLVDARKLKSQSNSGLLSVLKSHVIKGLPEVAEHGQGGLLDVVLHPKYAENGWIYWTYNAGSFGHYGTELARGKLAADSPHMRDVQVLFRMKPKSAKSVHFGSRIVFDRQGYLYVTLGDRGDSPDRGFAHDAQQLNTHAGKSIRLLDDGRIPPDNPYTKVPTALPEIFTWGHRNMQGAAMHPVTGEIWTHEHGPQGGDEINILSAGVNYGWPVITYGVNYVFGTKIGVGTAHPDMAQPLLHWTPSIAPSGIAFYTGDAFPKWQGNLFVGALAKELLVRVTLDGNKVVAQEQMFEGKFGRIRDVRVGSDGLIYLLTDENNGKLIRLEPV
ncbi:MAG: PQQ-dependent sugar dehydrogenase [Candidatus Nitrotoga sp.]